MVEEVKENSSLMSLKEVARYLGLHNATLYKVVKETDIPAAKIGGQWRFRKDMLDRWLANRMNREMLSNGETEED